MNLVIAKVDEVYFDGEAHSVTLPASAGEMTVLGEHMPLITTLKEGIITVHLPASGNQEFQIKGGIVEVRRDGATVIL